MSEVIHVCYWNASICYNKLILKLHQQRNMKKRENILKRRNPILREKEKSNKNILRQKLEN